MMRKKSAALSMDSRYSMMVENAFYSVNPPDESSVAREKRRPPMQEYVMKLLYNDLCR